MANYSWLIIAGLSLLSQFCNATIGSDNYVYPNGTIPCKVYNRTSLDCKYRKLISIPPLPHGGSLETLHLSSNKLPYLPDNAFLGLYKLKVLDLSFNQLTNITGSPFRDLALLQELHLVNNLITSIGNATFTGLKSLELLDMSSISGGLFMLDVIGTPLIGLQSLHVLRLRLDSNCSNTNSLFTGLDQLTDLELYICCGDPDWIDSICMLDSLHHLEIVTLKNISFDKCFLRIPLKCLVYSSPDYYRPVSSSYEHLKNLTILGLVYSDVIVPSLCTIDSPLEVLRLEVQSDRNSSIVLNSTTFAQWAKWSASLHILDIGFFRDKKLQIAIEGSPFSWFSNLRTLSLTANGLTHPLPMTTFKGLEKLEYFTMNMHIDVFTTNALNVFKHLRSLVLLNNVIDYTLPRLFCSLLSSLTYLDLSYNDLNFNPTCRPCPSLPKLKQLRMANCKTFVCTLDDLCDMSPQLYDLDLSGSTTSRLLITNSCPNLVTLDLSQSRSEIVVDKIFWPHLITLYLKQVQIAPPGAFYIPLSSVKQIMRLQFPNLTSLDLSSNQIMDIDEMDAEFLRNLTYLDLADNKLTSVKNLLFLKRLQTLHLNGNRITCVPDEGFLSKSLFPFLDFLALQDNLYVCDCNVETFRRWILGDDAVYLEMDEAAPFPPTAYQCLAPDSMKGLSITEVTLDCRSPLWLYLSISIPCAFMLILVANLAVRYRWHIQYKLFLLFNRRKRHHNYIDNDYEDIGQDDENGIPRFDAYVAYHEGDEDWVDRELLPNIEEGQERFRLCLRGRDVPAGRPLINALSLCIQRSRKSLVILSPRFVENNWCYFQLSMAHQRFLEEGRNVLVFIILDDIPNDKMTLILRQLFCKIRCLKWPNDGIGQRLFWERLRQELNRPVLVDHRYQIN